MDKLKLPKGQACIQEENRRKEEITGSIHKRRLKKKRKEGKQGKASKKRSRTRERE